MPAVSFLWCVPAPQTSAKSWFAPHRWSKAFWPFRRWQEHSADMIGIVPILPTPHFLVHVHSFRLSKPGWLYELITTVVGTIILIAIVRFSWSGYVWEIPEKLYLRCGIGLNFLWCGCEFQVCCFLFYFEGFLLLWSCPCAPHFPHWLCSSTLRRFTCRALTCPPLSI